MCFVMIPEVTIEELDAASDLSIVRGSLTPTPHFIVVIRKCVFVYNCRKKPVLYEKRH